MPGCCWLRLALDSQLIPGELASCWVRLKVIDATASITRDTSAYFLPPHSSGVREPCPDAQRPFSKQLKQSSCGIATQTNLLGYQRAKGTCLHAVQHAKPRLGPTAHQTSELIVLIASKKDHIVTSLDGS